MGKMSLKMKMNSKIKRVLSGGLFLVLILIVSIVIYVIVQRQRHDGIRINMAGRQRMLTQKITKEILLYSTGRISKEQIEKSQKVFNITSRVLSDGGELPLDLELSRFQVIPTLEDPLTKKQLKLVDDMHRIFGHHVFAYLQNRNPESLDYIVHNNAPLLKEINKSVILMQKTSEKNSVITKIVMIFFALIISILIFLVLLKKNMELKKNISHIRQLENILPICAYCKNIRINDDEPRNPHSWVTIEEHISSEEDVRCSHGICPECLEKYYPEYNI